MHQQLRQRFNVHQQRRQRFNVHQQRRQRFYVALLYRYMCGTKDLTTIGLHFYTNFDPIDPNLADLY